MSHTRPLRCTGITARVRGVIARSRQAMSMLKSFPTSTSTGDAPAWTTAEIVATNVWPTVTTSSPEPMPAASSERCSAW